MAMFITLQWYEYSTEPRGHDSDISKDYYKVGILKSGMHAAVLKEINGTYESFSKEVILEEFETYFEMLKREVFHLMLR
jgi:hypothetical protein